MNTMFKDVFATLICKGRRVGFWTTEAPALTLMTRGVANTENLSVLLCTILWATASAYSREYPLEISGEAFYEQYSPSGEIVVPLLSKSKFSAYFESNSYRIDTLKLTGVHPNELAAATIGWDGTNYFALATGEPYSYSKVYDRPGWPEDVSQGRYIWLAYINASVVRKSNSNPFSRFFFSEWVPYEKITLKFYPPAEQSDISKIEFMAPGEYVDRHSKKLVPYRAPFGGGYECAEYWLQYTNMDGDAIPISFGYSVYEVNPELPAQIGRCLVWMIRFNVTNIQIAVSHQEIVPTLRGRVIVSDYRYRNQTGGALQYQITNSLWLEPASPTLKKMVMIRRDKPLQATSSSARRYAPARRYVVIAILFCSTISLALIWLWKAYLSRKKASKQNIGTKTI